MKKERLMNAIQILFPFKSSIYYNIQNSRSSPARRISLCLASLIVQLPSSIPYIGNSKIHPLSQTNQCKNCLLPIIFAILLSIPYASVNGHGSVSANENTAQSSQNQNNANPVSTELLSSKSSLSPGETARLAVLLKPTPGWHIYYKNSGDSGKPTRVRWRLPDGYSLSNSIWQTPKSFTDSGLHTFGYDSEALIAADVNVPKDARPNDVVRFSATVNWLACGNVCVPGESTLTIDLPVKQQGVNSAVFTRLMDLSNSAANDPPKNRMVTRGGWASLPDTEYNSLELNQGWILYIGLAFLGGMILNLMPCVLPVIAIKIMSLMEQAKDQPTRIRVHGMTFSAGILSTFMSLALLVSIVKGTGQSIGWGFQFQYPPFIIFMSVVVLLFSLSLFGLFYVNISTGQEKLDRLSRSEGLPGTFFKGVLATTLSTPCTAPFLGTALGFAFSQSYIEIAAIFLACGLGMSSPYLLLCLNPDWIKYLPTPGAWMEKLKESLGFILLGTLLWLLSILNSQLGPEVLFKTCTFLLFVAFSSWIVGRFTDLSTSPLKKLLVWAISFAISGSALYVCLLKDFAILSSSNEKKVNFDQTKNTKDSIEWKPFSVAALTQSLKEGKTVFIDFTADWCLTCKANEATVLKDRKVTQKLKELGVVPMKADWTNQNAEITRMLKRFNRSGVPLYVIYPAKSPEHPLKLPDGIITTQQFLSSLKEAGPSIDFSR